VTQKLPHIIDEAVHMLHTCSTQLHWLLRRVTNCCSRQVMQKALIWRCICACI